MDGPAAVEERFAARFERWSIRLPDGAAERQEPGLLQQDGWTIRYVFGSDEDGSYLEFYATHRMIDDTRVRIYGSGATRELEAIVGMYGFDPKIPGDRERAALESRQRNLRIAEELDALGLYPDGNINAYLATHDVPPFEGPPQPTERNDRRS